MKWTIRRREDGQVLVQVALMIFVLVLFVGLAVDVGNVYGERRHMQNAADAGALAGARAICFGDPPDPIGQAQRYAIDENGADEADVEIIEEYKVRVVATVAAETYFIRLIPGLETIDVSAEAIAACGEAGSPCNLWPIAFDQETYDELPCNEPAFFVWVDDNWDVETLLDICGDNDNPAKCDCDPPAWAYGGHPMAAGHRGWLRLSAPPPGLMYDNEGGCGFDCGADSLKCWLEYLYSGTVSTGDCVPGGAGVTTAGLKAAETWEDKPVNIVLYDTEPCDVPGEGCPGAPYHVTGFGCVHVIDVEYKLTWDVLPGFPPNSCPKNEKVIIVTKLCPCLASDCSWTAGGPIPEGGIGAVSLIK